MNTTELTVPGPRTCGQTIDPPVVVMQFICSGAPVTPTMRGVCVEIEKVALYAKCDTVSPLNPTPSCVAYLVKVFYPDGNGSLIHACTGRFAPGAQVTVLKLGDRNYDFKR